METNKAVTALIEDFEALCLPSSVPIIERPSSLRFFRDYVSKNQPVILKKFCREWPAYEKWTKQYLIDTLGDKEITVAMTPNGRADDIAIDAEGNPCFAMPEEKMMTVGELFTRLENKSDKTIYYAQKQNSSLTTEFQVLEKDIDVKMDFGVQVFETEADAVNLWIGTEDSVTSMHKDHYENLYHVIKGIKRFTLIAPCYIPYLYYTEFQAAQYKETLKDSGIFSIENLPGKVPWIPVDPEKPDLKQYPLFEHVKIIQCDVEAGDTLYLPSLWYHRVAQKNDDSGLVIAVNHWFDMQYDSNYVYHNFLQNLCFKATESD